MNVAIIPSKKKSFRLKNKNTKKIDNLPAIILTIKNLIHSKIFSKIIVSSDDLNIVTLLKYYKLGHTVEFFKRSKKLCNNEVSTRNVILDVIKKMNIKSNNIVTCVYPTSFLINKNDIKSSIKLLKKKQKFLHSSIF